MGDGVCLPQRMSGSRLECRPGHMCSWNVSVTESVCRPHGTDSAQCAGGGGCGTHHLCGVSPGSSPDGGPVTGHQECQGGFCFTEVEPGFRLNRFVSDVGSELLSACELSADEIWSRVRERVVGEGQCRSGFDCQETAEGHVCAAEP